MRIINESNIPLLIFHIVPLYLSYRWLKEPHPVWSGVGGMMWFMLALLVLQDNPNNYVIVRLYTLFGVIFIMLTLVSLLKQLKDISEGRTDDDFFEF